MGGGWKGVVGLSRGKKKAVFFWVLGFGIGIWDGEELEVGWESVSSINPAVGGALSHSLTAPHSTVLQYYCCKYHTSGQPT